MEDLFAAIKTQVWTHCTYVWVGMVILLIFGKFWGKMGI